MSDAISKLYITGDITMESFNEFSMRLRECELEGDKVVQLEIISEGGDAYAGLAYFDRIRNSKVEIRGVATGLVASAASIIFIACHKRFMTKNAWLMVHEDTLSGIDDKKVSEIEKEARHARRMEDQWCELFNSVTIISKDYWAGLNRCETYLSSSDCDFLGILDGVVGKTKK